MTIHDTSPERRNLILLSLAFIIFYLADGHLTDDTVRVMVINLTFGRPYMLKYFTWLMLIWFCLRFWQKFGFNFWPKLRAEIMSEKVPASLGKYAESKARGQLMANDKLPDQSIKVWSSLAIVADVYIIESYSFYVRCNFINEPGSILHKENIKLHGIRNVVYPIREILIHSVKDNAFSEQLMPYLLFLFAVTAPFWSKML